MSYTTFLGDTFEDEHDEELTRKFGDTYKYFKRLYPELYKLPTEEARGIFHEFNKSPYGDTLEKSIARTNQYIENHMPDWQEQYINPEAQHTLRQSVQYQNPLQQVTGAVGDMITEYFKMKKHGYKYLDDYHHCKANYNAVKRGYYGEQTAQNLGFTKELVDKVKNRYIKQLSESEVEKDFQHDLMINATSRARAKFGNHDSDIAACADFREKNKKFPKEYW